MQFHPHADNELVINYNPTRNEYTIVHNGVGFLDKDTCTIDTLAEYIDAKNIDLVSLRDGILRMNDIRRLIMKKIPKSTKYLHLWCFDNMQVDDIPDWITRLVLDGQCQTDVVINKLPKLSTKILRFLDNHRLINLFFNFEKNINYIYRNIKNE